METFSRCLIETNKDFSVVAKQVTSSSHSIFSVYCMNVTYASLDFLLCKDTWSICFSFKLEKFYN